MKAIDGVEREVEARHQLVPMSGVGRPADNAARRPDVLCPPRRASFSRLSKTIGDGSWLHPPPRLDRRAVYRFGLGVRVRDLDVLILGAGFGGLCMGIELGRRGASSFSILERALAVGGTWRDNRYPGCACDVPAALYSYSFEPNPDWSRRYAEQSEIRAYLERCTDKYGLRSRIAFGEEVTSARFDRAESVWVVESASQRRYRARVVVAALGAFSSPSCPDITGRARFAGEQFH